MCPTGLGTVLSTTGAGALVSGLGSMVGVSGNLGKTDSWEHCSRDDGSYTTNMTSVPWIISRFAVKKFQKIDDN